jgi:hypothetical protein
MTIGIASTDDVFTLPEVATPWTFAFFWMMSVGSYAGSNRQGIP